MKNTFTPGPWTTIDGTIVCEHVNSYGNFIIAGIDRVLTPEDKANLTLITSAPELLKACGMALDFMNSSEGAHAASQDSCWKGVYQNLQEAIAKARGESC